MNVNILEHDSNRDPPVRESLYLPSGQNRPQKLHSKIRCNNSGKYILPTRGHVTML